MAGQVDLLIDSVGVLFPVYKAGLVKVLAITAAQRVSESYRRILVTEGVRRQRLELAI